jgi:hypothetical protein
MHRLLMVALLIGSVATAFAADAITGRVIKVLPLFLDHKGHDALSPSLFDRDAYQAQLRQHTNEVSTIRLDILWKTSGTWDEKVTLRAELRGVGLDGLPHRATLEQTVTPKMMRSWTSLKLPEADYKNFGELTAWRVTLWNGEQLLDEEKSFLW